MPHRSWDLRIQDIVEAIENILNYTEDMTFEQFCVDRKTIDAVVRNLTIIGEAASNLPDDITTQYPDIPWREMRDMRNTIVHEYFGVDLKVVWKTANEHIPELKPMIQKVLQDLERNDGAY